MSSLRQVFKPSEQLLVSWDKDLSIKVAGRAPSNIGKQGDHISAYHLIELLATSIAIESGLETCLIRFFQYFTYLLDKIKIEEGRISLDIQTAKDDESKEDEETLQKRYDEVSTRKSEIELIINITKKEMDTIKENDAEIDKKIAT